MKKWIIKLFKYILNDKFLIQLFELTLYHEYVEQCPNRTFKIEKYKKIISLKSNKNYMKKLYHLETNQK